MTRKEEIKARLETHFAKYISHSDSDGGDYIAELDIKYPSSATRNCSARMTS